MKRSLAAGMLGGVIVCMMLLVIASAAGAQGKDIRVSQPAASALAATPISSTFTFKVN